jgi:hypothetical protein
MMNHSTFPMGLRTAADQAVLFARQHVRQAISDEVIFLVYPNQSCDDNLRVGDEVVFPDESLPSGKYLGPWTAEEVVAFLWRDGKVPEWIDLAVQEVECHRSRVGLRCCGRFTAQEEFLYHRYAGGVPPFSIKSPVLPPGWENVEKSGKFDLYWRKQ